MFCFTLNIKSWFLVPSFHSIYSRNILPNSYCNFFLPPLEPKPTFAHDHWCIKTNILLWWCQGSLYKYTLITHPWPNSWLYWDPFPKAAFLSGPFGHMWSQHMFINCLRWVDEWYRRGVWGLWTWSEAVNTKHTLGFQIWARYEGKGGGPWKGNAPLLLESVLQCQNQELWKEKHIFVWLQ